ncbi:TetR/AcrR family transcriptional regulator [Arthrobacter sp. SDTb3-6]|uniref:TetR/AcrR family transcriptional regulator n=1 Tax=Arthrobacter sp. SDTb3-6 TaxID=2713571 RepID=UPI00159E1B96|nr:TetR/AcrR family transcriptional regulator [Arthrobacter sp. SDTb3-6]NVN00175.1 TetR/AcrR family transcriptional regulator [Arthrobacter sp. SDTb3-6]
MGEVLDLSEAASSKLLDAARRLFLAHGYDRVNLERIAKEAGVSRQTLYNRFGSKEAVFRAMLQRHWDQLNVSAFLEELNGPGGVPEASEVLRAFAQLLLRFVRENDQVDVIRLVIAESRRLSWIAEDFYRVGKAPLLDALAAALDRLSGLGRLQCPDAFVAAHQFFGLVQEMTLWPAVMAAPAARDHLPAEERVIDEAILTFLSRYAS